MSLVTDAPVDTTNTQPPILEQREQQTRVQAAMAGLSDNQQEAVRLRFADGLSYAEIAAVTGHSVSNVGVLLHVALKKMRAQLKDDQTNPQAGGGAR